MPERIDIDRYVAVEDIKNYKEIYIDHLYRYHWAADTIHHLSGDAKSVLDVPCGSGYGAHILTFKYDDIYAVGMDVSPNAISYANKYHPNPPNLIFEQGDMCNINFPDNNFDAVVSFEGIEHVSDSEKAVQEMHRVLQPGGFLLASIPIESAGNEWHKRWFPDTRSIDNLFEPIFGAYYFISGQTINPEKRGIIYPLVSKLWDDQTAYWIITAQKVE